MSKPVSDAKLRLDELEEGPSGNTREERSSIESIKLCEPGDDGGGGRPLLGGVESGGGMATRGADAFRTRTKGRVPLIDTGEVVSVTLDSERFRLKVMGE